MRYCGQQGCQGHMSKFSDCLTEAIWQLSMDGGADETTGDATDWGAHFQLFTFTSEETVTVDNGPTVTVPVGAYILVTYSSGSVYCWEYGNDAEAREEFDAQAREYGKWLDSQDD